MMLPIECQFRLCNFIVRFFSVLLSNHVSLLLCSSQMKALVIFVRQPFCYVNCSLSGNSRNKTRLTVHNNQRVIGFDKVAKFSSYSRHQSNIDAANRIAQKAKKSAKLIKCHFPLLPANQIAALDSGVESCSNTISISFSLSFSLFLMQLLFYSIISFNWK